MTGQLLVRGIDLEKRPCKMVVVFRMKNVVNEIKRIGRSSTEIGACNTIHHWIWT